MRRIQAVILLDEGENLDKIARITAIKRSRIFQLRQLYLKKGLSSLLRKPRREKSLLNKKQIREIKKILKDPDSPTKLGFSISYWTTRMLADYIRLAYGVTYKSKTSYYLLFKKVKFTYHKPGRVYAKRDEKEVRVWRKETKPILKKAWNDPDTVILTADEMVLSTQTTFQKIWLPQGTYPKIKVSNTRENRSIYGFLNLKTGREHAFITLRQNMFITAGILKKIRRIYPKDDHKRNKLRGKKILLLWDGPGWHRGSEVTQYTEKDGKIQIVFFPRYAPEENPQEHVWKEGRSKVTHNRFIEDIKVIANDFVVYLNKTKFNYSLLGFSPIL